MKKLVLAVMMVVVFGAGVSSGYEIIDVENNPLDFEKFCKSATVEDFEALVSKIGPDGVLNKRGETLLIAAARLEMFGIVKRLCNMGANVNIKDELGITPLVCAAIRRNTKMVEYHYEIGRASCRERV